MRNGNRATFGLLFASVWRRGFREIRQPCVQSRDFVAILAPGRTAVCLSGRPAMCHDTSIKDLTRCSAPTLARSHSQSFFVHLPSLSPSGHIGTGHRLKLGAEVLGRLRTNFVVPKCLVAEVSGSRDDAGEVPLAVRLRSSPYHRASPRRIWNDHGAAVPPSSPYVGRACGSYRRDAGDFRFVASGFAPATAKVDYDRNHQRNIIVIIIIIRIIRIITRRQQRSVRENGRDDRTEPYT